ncbi:hypothetical protein ACFVH9_08655 [Streptomyces hirsutus]|uniref:hypothetical protein n=1 Tax=Streptomyces hirsutus TaxID=35620 RepID=UPI0036285D6A
MADWMHVGAGACFAGSGALALVTIRRARRSAALEAAVPARLHVDDVQHGPASPGTGGLEAFGPYEAGDADAVDFHYCPTEARVTAHAVHADGVRRCWHCEPIEGDA